MARCSFAEWVPIALTDNQKKRKITPTGLVCHTAVSNSSLLRPTGEVRWHFYLNKTGQLYQFFDTSVYAPCHRDGNYWTSGGNGYGFLSCESWDGAGVVWDGKNVSKLPAWNDAQMKTWAKLGAWLHDVHGIPLVKATGPRGKGIGFHAQYTIPANKSGLRWNISHACPGPKRIAQMPALIAAMNAATKPAPKPTPKPILLPEEPMPLQLVQVPGDPAVYAITSTGAVHVKNPTHLELGTKAGTFTKDRWSITKAQLAQLLEKE